MRRIVSTAVVTAAVAAAVLLTAARSDSDSLKTYEIVFDNAFGLVEGGDLKIGGVKAGQTTGFRLTDTEPYRTIVSAEVTEPGFDSLRADARCDVRQQSLIGEYFIDCDLGRSEKKLPDRGRVPVEQTSSTIPPDLINDVMRRPYRERFRLILTELGTGLAGRPEELNRVIRRAHPALRELNETLAILRRQNTIIRDFFRDADTVSAAVEPFKEDVARWAREASETSAVQASRAEENGRYWNRLPDFLKELEPTMAQLERTATAQIPTLRSLQRAAPDLERFLRSAVPFARETRRAIGPLGDATAAGSEAITESREEIRELRQLAAFAPRLGKPLRQFLQALDDRDRSIEDDPAAEKQAPPAPDKTAYKKGQGFTGMEALWNYIHYQTLAINATDEFGHVLRIILFNSGPCPPYHSNPTETEIRECNSWLGDYQPGVTSPDPAYPQTATPGPPGSGPGSANRERVRHRGQGEPKAPPLPGKRDLSKPQIVIPKDVRELLDRVGEPLGQGGLPSLPAEEQRSTPTELLDYLLTP